MAEVKIKCQALVSGVYPFQGNYEKCGYRIVNHIVDQSKSENIFDMDIIYLSPYLGLCIYPDADEQLVYLTLERELFVEIEYPTGKLNDRETTNNKIKELNLINEIETIEKMMVLEINNNIKFPIKKIEAFDAEGNRIAYVLDFTKLNIPCLIGTDREVILETMKRQNNRLSSGFSYEKIKELKDNNEYFDNALTIFYSSFAVNDINVSFILLVTALESLLSKSTYEKIENCETCGQPMYRIRTGVSENVGVLLNDKDGTITRYMKKMYDKRSAYVHSGIKKIDSNDLKLLQECARKVLLMYWYISMETDSFEHKKIMKKILSINWDNNLMAKQFLIALNNTAFKEKKIELLREIISALIKDPENITIKPNDAQ